MPVQKAGIMMRFCILTSEKPMKKRKDNRGYSMLYILDKSGLPVESAADWGRCLFIRCKLPIEDVRAKLPDTWTVKYSLDWRSDYYIRREEDYGVL